MIAKKRVATVLTVYGIETARNMKSSNNIRVATVLTVYGIETICSSANIPTTDTRELQQYLPFTVLKLLINRFVIHFKLFVATVLTVYGIETEIFNSKIASTCTVATVLTVYGIETASK